MLLKRVQKFLKNNTLDIIFLIVVAIVAFNVTKSFAILNIIGESMFPTYTNGDVLILKKSKEPSIQDIIVFEAPESWSEEPGGKQYIKRIVASEGDIVHFKNSYLKVNNDEPLFIDRPFCKINDVKVVIGKNKHFVLGDNITNSNDSLTQMCLNNLEYTIDESLISYFGEEIFTFTKH